MKLSICIPVYNEQDSIRVLYGRLISVLENLNEEFEIIVVNDGSTDDSERILDDLCETDKRVRAVHFSSNFGQTAAMMAGIEQSSGDVIVSMDGDNQNDPEDIPRLLEKIKEGFDVVSGWRKKRKDDPLRQINPSVPDVLSAN